MDDATNQKRTGRLVIVSNRLPIIISKENGELNIAPGSGGLLTALAPVLRNRGGLWIGWPGPVDEDEEHQINAILAKESRTTGFLLHPIFLSENEIKQYYEGFSNEIIWPLFHDLQSECRFNPVFWNAVHGASRKFALGTFRQLKYNDFIWIHDYHLMLVGQELRKLGVKEKIAFFLHIPFPPLDIYLKLPWRFQVLRALLEYDLIGFQTLRDQRNFIHCVKRLLADVKTVNKRHLHLCQTGVREVRVASFPISVDYQGLSEKTSGAEVANQAWRDLEHLKGQKIVFSCDRLDISKGIPYRLEAIRQFLRNHPEFHKKVTFLQVIVPSRTEIAKYQELKNEVDRLVGEINSQYTKTGWVPIHYVYSAISHKQLLAFYRIAEIALITPIKDGMNLVAKEYVACNVDETGGLILSEFAGAATQLQREAFLINPYDVDGVAEAIYNVLTLSSAERKRRMRKMRRSVGKNDVFWWVRNFLTSAIAKELRDFPVVEDYTPTELTG